MAGEPIYTMDIYTGYRFRWDDYPLVLPGKFCVQENCRRRYNIGYPLNIFNLPVWKMSVKTSAILGAALRFLHTTAVAFCLSKKHLTQNTKFRRSKVLNDF